MDEKKYDMRYMGTKYGNVVVWNGTWKHGMEYGNMRYGNVGIWNRR